MATYAIGDIQGCHEELQDLLDLVEWSPSRDRLWLVGDLVNRGPDSLGVLRFAKKHAGHVKCVLGNHDLHLLAASDGVRKPKKTDTFLDVLKSGECGELLAWLRCQPLAHQDPVLDFTMVHAGLPPQWGVAASLRHARTLSEVLRSVGYRDFLSHMYGDEPSMWCEGLLGWDRLRFICNALTRVRYCHADGRLAMGPAGPPEVESADLIPWFAHPDRKSRGHRIVFGHWATLQQCARLKPVHDVFHVDSGCVWGGGLTALRLEDLERFTVPSRGAAPG